jgi:hypothetical protein
MCSMMGLRADIGLYISCRRSFGCERMKIIIMRKVRSKAEFPAE